jgi:hypothetical protein
MMVCFNLLAAIIIGTLAAGYAWLTRREMRTGKPFVFFVPVEGWSRDRFPKLFAARQAVNWIFVAFLALVALVFLAEFVGLVHA